MLPNKENLILTLMGKSDVHKFFFGVGVFSDISPCKKIISEHGMWKHRLSDAVLE